MTNRDTIDAYLAGTLKFSRAGRAGALGNMEVESNYSPTAYNATEGAIGLCQWELGRRTALQAYAARHGGKETDLAMQLGYLSTELHEAEFADVWRVMRESTSPATAAAFWDANYERSAGTSRSLRIAKATRIYDELGAIPPPPHQEEPMMTIVRKEGGGASWLLVGLPRTIVMRDVETAKNLIATGVRVVTFGAGDYFAARAGALRK